MFVEVAADNLGKGVDILCGFGTGITFVDRPRSADNRPAGAEVLGVSARGDVVKRKARWVAAR